jgi:type VI protein secretion system component VasA
MITIQAGREQNCSATRRTKSGIKRETRKEQEQPTQPLDTSLSLILINHNPLGHTLDNLSIKLDCMISREANLFCEVIRQYIHQISISVGVEKRFICKLRVFVAQA